MAVPTDPRQPVVYEMMVLSYALMRLRKLDRLSQDHPRFPARQLYLITAFTTPRSLAEFAGKPGGDGRDDRKLNRPVKLYIDEPPFNGPLLNYCCYKLIFETLSNAGSHLHENRHRKTSPIPNVRTAMRYGKKVLRHIKPTMDRLQPTLVGDAKIWYARFEEYYVESCRPDGTCNPESTERSLTNDKSHDPT